MLIKVFPHGKGGGCSSIEYLLRLDYHGRKENPPEVVRGDPLVTRDLIDCIDREWKYTSGVISWSGDDTVTDEDQREVIDNFEAIAFAGLAPDQFNILWVRHSHVSRCELHFVIPRMELSTGNAFNAFPPGWQKDFDPLRDYENIRHGWSRPDDPDRARMFTPSSADIIEARLTRWGQNSTKQEKDKTRILINDYLQGQIESGLISDRSDILISLREIGLEINRESKSFITVKDPESNEKIRLKGGIYNAEWSIEKLKRQTSVQSRGRAQENSKIIQQELAGIKQTITGIIRKRASYNRERYKGKNRTIDKEFEPTLQDIEQCLRQTLDNNNTDRYSSRTRSNDRIMGAFEDCIIQNQQQSNSTEPDRGQNSRSQPDSILLRERYIWNFSDERRAGQVYSTSRKYDSRNKLEERNTQINQTYRGITSKDNKELSKVESYSNKTSKGEPTNEKVRTRNNRTGNNQLNRKRHQRMEEIGKSQNFRFAETIQDSLRAITRIGQLTRKITNHITRITHNLSSPRKTLKSKQQQKSQGYSR